MTYSYLTAVQTHCARQVQQTRARGAAPVWGELVTSCARGHGRPMLGIPSMASTRPVWMDRLRISNEDFSKNDAFITLISAEKKTGKPPENSPVPPRASPRWAGSPSPRFKVAEGLGRHPPVEPTRHHVTDPMVGKTRNEEFDARRRVYALRNQLAHARTHAAHTQWVENNQKARAEVQETTRRLHGCFLHKSVEYAPPATDKVCGRVATFLMRKIAEKESDPGKRGWFFLFKEFDENGDGRISYEEFMMMIRCTINVSEKQLREETIRSVWHAIDMDNNGSIDIAEFGRFFRLGDKPMSEARRREFEGSRPLPPQKKILQTPAQAAIRRSTKNRELLEEEERQLERQLRNTLGATASWPVLSPSPRRSLPPLR